MTILSDAWQVRVSVRMANQLTNPDAAQPNSVNTARLLAADADTKQEFLKRTGMTLDETNAAHILVGTRGITLQLLAYKGMPAEVLRAQKQEWFDQLDEMAGVETGGKTWVSPTTDSPLQQSSPPGNEIIRPLGDDTSFFRYVPRRGNAGNGGSLDNGNF